MTEDRLCELQRQRRDPGNLDCECGNRVSLMPHKDYMGEVWAGCHTRNLCDICPLNDVNKLLEKVKEMFGENYECI